MQTVLGQRLSQRRQAAARLGDVVLGALQKVQQGEQVGAALGGHGGGVRIAQAAGGPDVGRAGLAPQATPAAMLVQQFLHVLAALLAVHTGQEQFAGLAHQLVELAQADAHRIAGGMNGGRRGVAGRGG